MSPRHFIDHCHRRQRATVDIPGVLRRISLAGFKKPAMASLLWFWLTAVLFTACHATTGSPTAVPPTATVIPMHSHINGYSLNDLTALFVRQEILRVFAEETGGDMEMERFED